MMDNPLILRTVMQLLHAGAPLYHRLVHTPNRVVLHWGPCWLECVVLDGNLLTMRSHRGTFTPSMTKELVDDLVVHGAG